MSGRWLLALAALLATPVAAQDVDELADRFERALVAGDYRVLPLTEDFAYTENGAQLDPWDGMWRTLTAVEGAEDFPELDYRVELISGDAAVRVVEFDENTVQGVMAYRLVARDGQIASVDILPIREEFGGDRGGTLTLLQPMLPVTMDGERVAATSPLFSKPGAIYWRHMSGVVSAYFHGGSLFSRWGDEVHLRYSDILAASDCNRFDNGLQVTNVANADILDLNRPDYRPYALGCGEQVLSGYYSNFEPHFGLTFFHGDRGLAIAWVRLDQPGTVLSFTTPEGQTIAYPGPRAPAENADSTEQFDGRILTNMITPMSVNGVYIFKFNAAGEIQRIDAFYRGAPLGWDAVPD